MANHNQAVDDEEDVVDMNYLLAGSQDADLSPARELKQNVKAA